MELTDKNFWKAYWSSIKLPVVVNLNFKNDRVIASTILKHLPKADYGRKMLEIGCAPGKWLVFFNKELKFHVTGLEYVEIAAKKTRENLKKCNIASSQYKVITGNFLSQKFDEKFHVVISLGFVEHFENYEEIMVKHLDALDDCGYLIIGLPRFVGINYFVQKLIDPFLSDKMLPSHNLSIMNLKIFEQFAKKYKLEIVFNDYVGGFARSLFPYTAITRFFPRFFILMLSIFLTFLFGKMNNKYVSSYQLAILKKG